MQSSCPSNGIFVTTSTNSAPRPIAYVTSSVCDSFQQRNFASAFSTNQCKIPYSGQHKLKRASIFDQGQDIHAKTSGANGHKSSRECQEPSKRVVSFADAGDNEDDRRTKMFVEENKETLKDSIIEQSQKLGCDDASALRANSCSLPLLADKNVGLENNTQSTEKSERDSFRATICHRSENPSSIRELDYKMSVTMSPEDVVLKMGQENFWKARRILINQQRILSFQLFELHRLVKVQRSLVQSSHSLIEDKLCVSEVPITKELPLPPPPSTHTQPKYKNMKMPFPSFLYDLERVTQTNTRLDAPTSPPSSPPLPPPNLEPTDLSLNSVVVAPRSSSIPTPPLSSNQCQMGTPVMSSLENHLLIPVMSSEGLVYKPLLNAPAYGIPIAVSYVEPRGFSKPNPTSHEAVEDGSTASSSVGRATHDALPLFPMEPTAPTFENGGTRKETLAIKPIPLYGRLTNESAMRIFHSIQEE